ncbi:Conjugal transfer, TrbG/VirB9/CagX [Candidatus Magnetomorum sp. HK-1]|nr:Conjugal transfer, TrbG/VirB9/CagX [Candidatus Magnetomorum sp. HK-1]
MNILKQEGAAILEFWAVVTVVLTLGLFANSNIEIKKRTPEETIKIKPIVKYVEKNPVSHAFENTSIPVYKKVPIHHNRFQTPKMFKSSQSVIRKVNRSAHIKPFIANKGNLLGYKGACMKYPFSSKVFHVDVKYPVATYFSLPVGVSIISASFIADTAATGFSSNILNGKKIVSGTPPDEQEHIIIQPIGNESKDAQILVFTSAGTLNIMLHVVKKKQDEPMYCVEWVLPPPEPVIKKRRRTITVDSNYEINGNWNDWESCYWLPEVWNDGRQTYIKYKEMMRDREHPVLFGTYKTSFLKFTKKTQIKSSYDSESLTQIVDGVPKALVLTMGKKELEINRLKFEILEVGVNENRL